MLLCDNCHCRTSGVCDTPGYVRGVEFHSGTDVSGTNTWNMCQRCRHLFLAAVDRWWDTNEARQTGVEIFPEPEPNHDLPPPSVWRRLLGR